MKYEFLGQNKEEMKGDYKSEKNNDNNASYDHCIS